MLKLLKSVLVAIMTTESRIIIRKYKPFIVAITGSVGKTSTKDAIYDVLKDNFSFTRKSEKSMNSEIGLPLTVIGVSNAWYSISEWFKNIFTGLELILWNHEYPKCLVLEIGADHPGDIEKVTKWLKPDIAVITRISQTPVHVEFFSSPEQVFKEKSFLAKAVKDGGHLIVYGDQENTLTLVDLASSKKITVHRFGLNDINDIKAQNISVDSSDNKPVGMRFDLLIGEERREIKISGILGNSYIYSFLAAAAVGKSRNMSIEEIARGLSEYAIPHGRMNIIEGINNSVIIDDSYNSSPDASVSALETLKSVSLSGDKIVVLGDMMELGQYSVEAHRKIGEMAANISDKLITVGPRSRLSLIAGAEESGMSHEKIMSFDSSEEAGTFLAPTIKAGDIVLVKGSQSMRMEKVVKALMKDKEKAFELLVRQEKEWLLK